MALAHFQRTFTDAAGNIKPGLAVTVRRESDNGLAALFADAGSVTAKSNPFNTDANGYGSFYVVDGRYRIQATDIDWRNEDLISQPSPNFTTMPQVGGDPIVESGSNADGKWTRWADGTQVATAVVSVSFNGDTGFPSRRVYPPPVAFLFDEWSVDEAVAATATVTDLNASGRPFSAGLMQAFELDGADPGNWVVATVSPGTADVSSASIALSAIGRWK